MLSINPFIGALSKAKEPPSLSLIANFHIPQTEFALCSSLGQKVRTRFNCVGPPGSGKRTAIEVNERR